MGGIKEWNIKQVRYVLVIFKIHIYMHKSPGLNLHIVLLLRSVFV